MKKNNDNSFIKKITSKLSDLLYKFRSLSIVKHILVFYLFITLVGSLLLFLPISYNDGQSVEYVDALFTSASAFSDTGLATLTTATTWSFFGQAIIAILILVGGIGWFALKIYFFNIIFGRTISFNSRKTLAAERGSSQLGDTRQIVKISVTILFILIILASIVLSVYFYLVEPDINPFGKTGISPDEMLSKSAYHDVATSFRWGLFHAISGLNNAGFDIIGAHSLEPYYHKYGLQIIFMTLFIIGGIGYPVIYDIYLWIKSKFKKTPFKWSLFTKISMIAYVLIAIIGVSFTFIIEVNRSSTPNNLSFWSDPKYGSNGDKIMALVFNTMSTRNAGFATVEMADLSSATLMVYIIMMFIGSAPSSTAGGIRTTTIAIVFMGVWSKIRGKNSVGAFNKKIPESTVSRSYVVLVTASIIVIFTSMISISSFSEYGGSVIQGHQEGEHSYLHMLFEVGSAFGTTGLSTGVTSDLSIITKISLIVVMFIGQLGVSSSLLVWDSKKSKSRKYDFIQEDISIG